MQDYQVRQKSAQFFEQNETWADTNLTENGDIGFVEISGNTSNQSFVYYGNNDIITISSYTKIMEILRCQLIIKKFLYKKLIV